MPHAGDVIQGKYRLVRLLGDGGMGSVYEATHALLGTRVAIKVLHVNLARKTGLIDRFLQEARVAAQIRSPHVVQVTDVDRTPEGLAYIVMELLEGEPLSAMLDRQRKLHLSMACEFTSQILEALEAAHALGVTHRDLKPENVFVTYQAAKPVVKLIDFGIAKLRPSVPGERSLTVAGMLMGTAEYMAPEQAFSADRVDARSDLYAVGVLLYEMLSARRPVVGTDARTIAAKVERGEATPLVHVAPEVPREIAGLVHRAMAARPELRFASATEMRLALDAALAGKRTGTTPILTPGPISAPHGGTLQAAPMHGAFTPLARATARATPPESSPRTERAQVPPSFSGAAAHAHTAPASSGTAPAVAPSPPRSHARRGGGGATWAILVVPIVLGVGGVVTWAVTSQPSAPPAPAATIYVPPAWTAPTAQPASVPAGIAPLQAVLPGAPPPHTSGAHAPHAPPSASAAASAPPEAAYAPTPFAFPSAFPFPSADGGATLLPFPLPSGFPTALPSVLPIPFPVPQAPAPSPTPSATPSPARSI